MKESRINVIISPHCDDELIGCYEIIANDEPTAIIFTEAMEKERQEESLSLRETYKNLEWYFFTKEIPSGLIDLENTFYFPDPIHETHPHHRMWGYKGIELLRKGIDVRFYSVNMKAPYIRVLEKEVSQRKKELLDKTYPSQKSLWEMDHGLWLFEGRCKWE